MNCKYDKRGPEKTRVMMTGDKNPAAKTESMLELSFSTTIPNG